MQRCDDPECPECGCNASTLIDGKARFGLPSQRRRCDHCGHSWSVVSKTWRELVSKKKPGTANKKKLPPGDPDIYPLAP